MMSVKLFEFLVIASVSLAITFVLFKKLDSYAEGKTKFLGGSIRYGGSLGGFLLVCVVLFHSYSKMLADGESTTIDLNGKWDIVLTTGNDERRSGTATIQQQEDSARLQISGEIESTIKPPSISFSSLTAVLRDARLVFLYETSDRQIGIAMGDIQSDKPKTFSVSYFDVLSADTNDDLEGGIKFSRTK